MPFCTGCGSPVGAANKFCVSCGTPVAAAAASSGTAAAPAATAAAPAAAPVPAGRGLSSNKGTDWLPATLTKDNATYGGSLQQTEQVLGELLNETNRTFGQLGVSVSASRAPASQAAGVECPACFRPIRGAAVQALGKTLHPACFTCHRCHEQIGESSSASQGFVVRGANKDQAWCDACVQKEKASLGGSGATGAGAASQSNSGVQPFRPAGASSSTSSTSSSAGSTGLTSSQRDQFLSRRDEGKTHCAGCGAVMLGDGVVTKTGTFHEECFCCAQCAKPIGAQNSYAERAGRAYHATCLPGAGGSGGAGSSECSKCRKSLVGKFVRDSSGAPYHRECFVCVKCNKDLSAGYALRDGGRPHCSACASAATPFISGANPAGAAVGGVAGMRYNQVTREVTRFGPGSNNSNAAAAPSASPAAAASTTTGSTPASASAGASKFCTSCGTSLAGSKFCPECGAKA